MTTSRPSSGRRGPSRVLGAVGLVVSLALTPEALAASVGVMLESDTPCFNLAHRALVRTVRGRAKDTWVVLQKPKSTTMAWVNTARRFQSLKMAAVVVFGRSAGRAALEETKDIPVVVVGVDTDGPAPPADRVAVITWSPAIEPALEMLDAIRSLSTLAVVVAADDPAGDGPLQAVTKAARARRVAVVPVTVSAKTPPTALPGNVDGVLMAPSAVAMRHAAAVAELAIAQHVPSAAVCSGSEDEGIVVTVAPNPADLGRRAGKAVAALLKGGAPSDVLPAGDHPASETTINLKAAASAQLTVPTRLVASATRVIK